MPTIKYAIFLLFIMSSILLVSYLGFNYNGFKHTLPPGYNVVQYSNGRYSYIHENYEASSRYATKFKATHWAWWSYNYDQKRAEEKAKSYTIIK